MFRYQSHSSALTLAAWRSFSAIIQRLSIPIVLALKLSMKRRSLYMPNVDFKRKLITSKLAKSIDSPDFERKLLTVKAILDYEDQDIMRLNFMDTLRPELWCIEGLARHLEPLPGRRYGMHLAERLPRIPARFAHLPRANSARVLHVPRNPTKESFD